MMLNPRPTIEVQGLDLTLPSAAGPVEVLRGVSLIVPERRFVSLLGPSGCGKTSLFNVLVGLIEPTRGEVWLDGQPLRGLHGRFGYMLQKDLLLPWRTALQNAILGPELAGVPLAEARQEAADLFARFGMAGFECFHPATLSAGMRQRVAMIRTLLYGKDVLLLDEPLGALDAMTRFLMQQWLLQVWSELGRTVVLVTHDVEEAIYLSDRIYLMSARPGRVIRAVDIPLARPRVPEMLSAPELVALKRELVAEIARESVRTNPEWAVAARWLGALRSPGGP